MDNDPELEVIRHQMEGTRASLADKLDTLENQVIGTVQGATDAVAHTVEDVKSAVGSVTDTVQETVESVKEAFNLSEHVRRHPWMSLGGAVAAGFVGGYLLGPSRSEERRSEEWAELWEDLPLRQASRPVAAPVPPPSQEESEGGILQTLKGLAIGTLMNLVREVASSSLPDNLKPDVLKLVDDFTTKLGGKPLHRSEESESGDGQQSASQREEQPSTKGGRQNGHGNKAKMGGQMGAAQGEGQEPVGKSHRRRTPPGRR